MTYSDACPKCGDYDYEIEDYGDDFDQFGGSRWWKCRCPKCGYHFYMNQVYKLTEVYFEEVSES